MTRSCILSCLAGAALLALAAPASAEVRVPGPDDAAQGVHPALDAALATAGDAVDAAVGRIQVRSPVEAQAQVGIECHPSATSPTGQECYAFVCVGRGGEGDTPVVVGPGASVGVDPRAASHPGSYGPYTTVTVLSDCGCGGIGMQWVG